MGLPNNAKRTPIYTALRHHLILSLGVVAALPSSRADEASHQEWYCRTDPDIGWICTEQAVPGKAYKRPHHGLPPGSPESDEPRVRLTRNLDWVDEERLSEAERRQMAPGCCGAYIEPPRNYPDSRLNPDDAPLRVSATYTESQDNIAKLEGDVQVSQGYRQVRSDHAQVDQEARTVDLNGNVQFREPNILMLGDKAHVEIDTREVNVDNATYVFHDSGVRGTASRLSRSTDDIIYIDNATYTACEPGNNAWRLAATKVSIDRNTGIATAHNLRLKVRDWPVFYLPWLRYPVDDRRATGLLFPHLSFGNDNGTDYGQPVYLNLAPNYDATLTPRYIEERGPMAELELRHLSPWSLTSVSGGYLWDDDGGDDPDDDPDPVTGLLPHQGQDRWIGNVDHLGGTGYNWSTAIDYTKVSDSDYFRDLGNATLEVNSQTHLRQMVSAGYGTDSWRFNIKGEEFQTIIDGQAEQYKQLPRVDAIGDYRFDSLDLLIDLKHQYTYFDHDEPGRITGNRLRVDYGITWDKQWVWGFFKPSVMGKYLTYDLDRPVQAGGDETPDVAVPVGAVDMGLYFERDTRWLGGFLQTFEPRVYYLHSEFEDQTGLPDFDTSELTFSYQQLFRDDRFSGGDRIGDADQVTVGLTTRLVAAGTGIERIRASIGQIYYLDNRYVSLDNSLTQEFLDSLEDPSTVGNKTRRDLARTLLNDASEFAAELAARFWNDWRLQADVIYDDDNGTLDKGSFALRYNNSRNAIFNLAYRYTRQGSALFDIDGDGIDDAIDKDIEQADVSFILPLIGNLNFVGRWNQDLTNSRELEIFGGFEYNSCCWRLSLVARRWLDRDDRLDSLFLLPEEELEHDEGIFFQIQLKGLAGTGSRVDGILQDGIYGYKPPQF